MPAAVHAVGLCEQLGRSVRGSSSARALAEAAVVRLAAADKFVDASSLVERLEQLAGRPAAAGGTGASYARSPAASPAPGQKKNPIAVGSAGPSAAGPDAARPADPHGPVAAGGGPTASASASGAGSGSVGEIQWNPAWFNGHWEAVVAGVGSHAASLGGLLKPARVLSAEPGAVQLGYDTEYEAMRQRAVGDSAGRIEEALSRLAGRPVKCRFVPTGRSGGPAMTAGGVPMGGISTEQRQQVADDPAVRAVLELFGGQLADVRLDVEPVSVAERLPATEPEAPLAPSTHAPAGLEDEED